ISEIGSFRRHDERRVHLDRHRQFTPRAIVDDAALRRKIEAPLLLVLGAALEIDVAENLKINQPQTDRQQPEAQESRQDVEPESCAVRRGTCRHFSSQFSVLSSQSEIVSFSLRTENWELRTALLRHHCDRSVSILYPYSIARKCCSAYPMTSRNKQHSASPNCFISRSRRGSSIFTTRELSMLLRK